MLLNPIQACFNYFKIIISVPIIEAFFSGLLMFSFLFFLLNIIMLLVRIIQVDSIFLTFVVIYFLTSTFFHL